MSRKFYSSKFGGRQLQHLYRFFQELDQRLKSPRAQHTDVPSICVGNFQAGGTGKTPTTRWIAQYLSDAGYSPIIVLRGYKGSITTPTLVKDSHSSQEVGDEALLHAANFPTVIGANRLKACELAAQHAAGSTKPVLLLDDGLQHYTLRADFNIACTKSPLFWEDTLLPVGRLRQIPVPEKIDAVIAVNSDAPTFWKGVPVYQISQETSNVKGMVAPGLMVAGIANSSPFFQFLSAHIPGQTSLSKAFGDHHIYTAKEVRDMEIASAQSNYLVHCTAKDAVKLEPLVSELGSPLQLCVWDVITQSNNAAQLLLDAVVAKIEEVYTIRPSKGKQKA